MINSIAENMGEMTALHNIAHQVFNKSEEYMGKSSTLEVV